MRNEISRNSMLYRVDRLVEVLDESILNLTYRLRKETEKSRYDPKTKLRF
jgi:hypothetical protein